MQIKANVFLSFAEKKLFMVNIILSQQQNYPILLQKNEACFELSYCSLLTFVTDVEHMFNIFVLYVRNDIILQSMSIIYDVQTNKWREIHNTTEGLTGLSGLT